MALATETGTWGLATNSGGLSHWGHDTSPLLLGVQPSPHQGHLDADSMLHIVSMLGVLSPEDTCKCTDSNGNSALWSCAKGHSQLPPTREYKLQKYFEESDCLVSSGSPLG